MDRLNSVISNAVASAESSPADAGSSLLGTLETVISPQERLALIVRSIETDIVPRLVRAHRPATLVSPVDPVTTQHLAVPKVVDAAVVPVRLAEGAVDDLVRLVLANDDGAALSAVELACARGVAVADIYVDLLAPVARQLGSLWDDDRVDFGAVTVGVGRLQRLIRSLAPEANSGVLDQWDGRRVLLVPAPGDQHTFGLSIVAEFFRSGGWEVVGDFGIRQSDPAAIVRGEWFDVIGISAGSQARLDWLTSGITAIRQASCNRAIGVMVGGPCFVDDPSRARHVGADATAVDGRRAPAVADQLLASRVDRL